MRPRLKATRCWPCGCGYLGREPGERCLDRSGPRRRRMQAERAGIEYLGPDSCLGILVSRSEYRRLKRKQNTTTNRRIAT
jgi:hypothetical protein